MDSKTETILGKIGVDKVIEVPIRRVGMTGSGKNNVCHSNVCNLVKYYGGSRLFGYIVNPVQEFIGFTHMISHSVWITPEENFADVTAHNYSKDNSHQVLYVVGKEKLYTKFLAEFLIPNFNDECEIYADLRFLTRKFLLEKKKIRKIYGSDFVEFVSDEISIKNLLHEINFSSYEKNTMLSRGDFAVASSATNQNWKQLKRQYKVRN